MKKLAISSIICSCLLLSSCSIKQEQFYLTEWALQSDGGYTTNHKLIIKNKKEMAYWENSVNLGQIGPITGPYVQVSEFEIKLVDTKIKQ